MAGGLSPRHSGCTSPRHKDRSVRWEDFRGLVLQMANWVNRGARDSLIHSEVVARPELDPEDPKL